VLSVKKGDVLRALTRHEILETPLSEVADKNNGSKNVCREWTALYKR